MISQPLNKLENTNDENIQKLSDNFKAIPDKDISRLYAKSEEKYRSKKSSVSENDKAEKISVITYKKPVFIKILAIASCILLIAGITTAVLKNQNIKPIPSDTSSHTNTEKNLLSPFGDISDCQVRCVSISYNPYILKTSSETSETLSEIFNSEEWTETDEDMMEGETGIVYVKGSDKLFRLTFGSPLIVQYYDGENSINYKVSKKIWEAGLSTACPENISGRLIPSKPDDLTLEGLWKNNEPCPDKIFVPYDTPDEFKGKNVLNNEPLYEFAYDISNIEYVGENSDNIVTGKVTGIKSNAYGTYENGKQAVTNISVLVSDDAAGKFKEGDTIVLTMLGGYISERDLIGQVREMTGGKYGEAKDKKSDEEIDSTCIHEIVGSGEIPITGKEYAFFVSGKSDEYYISGEENGILYKCDNIYIHRNGNFYDIDDLKALLK